MSLLQPGRARRGTPGAARLAGPSRARRGVLRGIHTCKTTGRGGDNGRGKTIIPTARPEPPQPPQGAPTDRAPRPVPLCGRGVPPCTRGPACRSPTRLPAAGHGGGRLPAGPGARIAAWRSSRRPPSPSGTDPTAAPRRPHPTRKWVVTGSPGCRREHRPRQPRGLGQAPPPRDGPTTSTGGARREGGRHPAPHSAAEEAKALWRLEEGREGGRGVGGMAAAGPAAGHSGSGSSQSPSGGRRIVAAGTTTPGMPPGGDGERRRCRPGASWRGTPERRAPLSPGGLLVGSRASGGCPGAVSSPQREGWPLKSCQRGAAARAGPSPHLFTFIFEIVHLNLPCFCITSPLLGHLGLGLKYEACLHYALLAPRSRASNKTKNKLERSPALKT